MLPHSPTYDLFTHPSLFLMRHACDVLLDFPALYLPRCTFNDQRIPITYGFHQGASRIASALRPEPHMNTRNEVSTNGGSYRSISDPGLIEDAH